ncbi:uncharacterized protein [Miscanthus floridulus]|uniref:uncharacterized protein isoform X2 n=1 Tax=Miscanthus floridulus TaxID=154761 RepID=UPI003457E0AD
MLVPLPSWWVLQRRPRLCDCLRQDDPAVNPSVTVMENGWESLKMLHDEFLPAGNDDGHAATEAVNSAQSDTNVEPDDESDDEEVIVSKMLVHWANETKIYRDFMIPPHPAIFSRLDLLATGWGWERLVPFYDAPRPHWSMYKNYLTEYWRHNSAESISQAWEIVVPAGNGIRGGDWLTALASLCVKMEEQFISLCEEHGFGGDDAEHIILSKEIKEHTLILKDKWNEFHVAAAALLLFTKQAELMCEWLSRGTCTRGSMITAPRRCALNLMMYTGSEYACAAGLMVGIAKEIKKTL